MLTRTEAAAIEARFADFRAGALGRADLAPPPDADAVENSVGDVPAIVDPSRIGNSRHLAAAQFVHDRRDALALVSSQDGRFTVLAWSEADGLVHAYRVETLLI